MVDSTHPRFRDVSKLVKESKESTKSALDALTASGLAGKL